MVGVIRKVTAYRKILPKLPSGIEKRRSREIRKLNIISAYFMTKVAGCLRAMPRQSNGGRKRQLGETKVPSEHCLNYKIRC